MTPMGWSLAKLEDTKVFPRTSWLSFHEPVSGGVVAAVTTRCARHAARDGDRQRRHQGQGSLRVTPCRGWLPWRRITGPPAGIESNLLPQIETPRPYVEGGDGIVEYVDEGGAIV